MITTCTQNMNVFYKRPFARRLFHTINAPQDSSRGTFKSRRTEWEYDKNEIKRKRDAVSSSEEIIHLKLTTQK